MLIIFPILYIITSIKYAVDSRKYIHICCTMNVFLLIFLQPSYLYMKAGYMCAFLKWKLYIPIQHFCAENRRLENKIYKAFDGKNLSWFVYRVIKGFSFFLYSTSSYYFSNRFYDDVVDDGVRKQHVLSLFAKIKEMK